MTPSNRLVSIFLNKYNVAKIIEKRKGYKVYKINYYVS